MPKKNDEKNGLCRIDWKVKKDWRDLVETGRKVTWVSCLIGLLERILSSIQMLLQFLHRGALWDKRIFSKKQLREDYAIQDNVIVDKSRVDPMLAFFNWTVWSASTNRPSLNHTYTNNWPHESLIDNVPTSANLMWSIVSIFILLTGVGFLVWYFSFFIRFW